MGLPRKGAADAAVPWGTSLGLFGGGLQVAFTLAA